MSNLAPVDISVDEARDHILADFAPLAVERIALVNANGAVLAAPIVASVDVPFFTNSAMDGYAARSSDLANANFAPVNLPIVESIAAGDPGGGVLAPGSAARIMTGAPLPNGADVVVPFEQTQNVSARWVRFGIPFAAGANVRLAGADARAGDRLIDPSTRIGPSQIALLASLGFDAVEVHRRPRVAVLATGDEVAPPGSPPTPGRIWNANSPMLLAFVAELGAAAIDLGIARDEESEIISRISDARDADADLLITSGGVSAGDFDVVKDVLARDGRLAIWRVNMKPGRPLAFGHIGSMPVIGLPGNPVAAAVSFQQFARPAILTMLGMAREQALVPEVPVTVLDPVDNRGGRRAFIRVSVAPTASGFEARLAGGQGSANLVSFARSNGLLVVQETMARVEPGQRLNAQMPGWKFD